MNRVRALSPKGEPVTTTTTAPLDSSYTLTILTTLDPSLPSPVVFDLHSDSNDQFDFYNFVEYLVTNNYLSEGDYLILDNASVHVAHETWPAVKDLLQCVT